MLPVTCGVKSFNTEIEQTASHHISTLQPGDQLQLRPEPRNAVNPNAIQITDGVMALGYVPDPLVGYVADVLSRGPYTLTVVMANSADTNPHLRLLLHLEGITSADTFDRPSGGPAPDAIIPAGLCSIATRRGIAGQAISLSFLAECTYSERPLFIGFDWAGTEKIPVPGDNHLSSYFDLKKSGRGGP
jgi:hypothetical protein